jgi:GntR family transcriptional regulator
LEHEGLVRSRQGLGTFVAASPPAAVAARPALLASLTRWVRRARAEGLEAEEMRALLSVALDEPSAASDERASGGVA